MVAVASQILPVARVLALAYQGFRSGSAKNDEKIVRNSSDLLALLDEPDVCVDVAKRQQLYVTTYPFSDADVQKVSWLFRVGTLDGWTDKITPYTVNTSTREYPPTPFIETTNVPIARLSLALGLPQGSSSKVKYLLVSRSKSGPEPHKLVVSHSRKAAGVDLFYEVLNGNSIVFVGAVLKHVAIPVEYPHKQPAIKFKQVESVKEAEEVGDGVVGVIC